MSDGELSRGDREALLERAGRPATLIGMEIPESVSLGGEEVPLRSVVLALASAESPDEAARAEARRLAAVLEREAQSVADSLRRDPDLTRAMAEAMYQRIVGLRRAASDLRTVGRRQSFGAAAVSESELGDAKRWVEFLKSIR